MIMKGSPTRKRPRTDLAAPKPPTELSSYDIDPKYVSYQEVIDYIRRLGARERRNPRRIQAWIDHCARIRGCLIESSVAIRTPVAGVSPQH